MHRYLPIGFLLLVAAAGAAEPAPAGKLVLDLWDAAYLDGNRAGFIHTAVREIERDGKKLFHTTADLDLTLKRFKETTQTQMQTSTVETAEGKVVEVSMRQVLARDQALVLTGKVVGDQLHVKVSGSMQMEKKIPWNEKVIGLYGEHQTFKQRAVKPGDTFSYLHYEPMINAVVTVQVAVKDFEEVEVDKIKKKLLRIESKPDPILGVQLPGTSFWLDANLAPVRSQVEMPPLGKLVTARTTKEVALSPVIAAKISDIGLTALVPLNRKIDKPHEAGAVVYKVTLPADSGDLTSALAQDSRQEVKNAKGKSFELHVKAVRQPRKEANYIMLVLRLPATALGFLEAGSLPVFAAALDLVGPDAEYLKSNYFITSDDAKVKELAKKAVGAETDPWKKAQRIEKWVNANMKVQNFTEAMAPADHVARNLEGDCTEYAMLTAAMCRAAGVPSKTAIGLVYVEIQRKGPVFAYHMWTEVWIAGQWLALDATLGRGSIGPCHIKITDHSWYKTESMVPLLPVMRIMLGKPAVEVVRVEGGS